MDTSSTRTARPSTGDGPKIRAEATRPSGAPASSTTSVTVRRPPRRRFLPMNTTKSTAPAIRACATRFSIRSYCSAYWASLAIASAADRAWMVDRDPLFPWLMALSISTTSGPITSPTTQRDGL